MDQRQVDALPPTRDTVSLRRVAWGGFWLGFALGGFFDGILLHQILQWHHLLSGVYPSETVGDLRFQVLVDGAFHLFTYLVAMLGLYLLFSARRAFGVSGQGRRVTAFALIGFGVWHIVDAVAFHWVLQLHRIRMDVENPLLWDLAWFIPFGLGAAALGWWLLRRAPPPQARRGRGGVVAGSLAALVLGGGIVAALPPTGLDPDMSLVVFRPGMDAPAVASAIARVDGRIVWTDADAGVWLVAIGEHSSPAQLYRHGALLVSNGPFAIGCLSWSRI